MQRQRQHAQPRSAEQQEQSEIGEIWFRYPPVGTGVEVHLSQTFRTWPIIRSPC
jgi:hypothetical protein